MNIFLLAGTVAFLPLLIPKGPGNTAPADVFAVLYLFVAVPALLRRHRQLHLPAILALALIAVTSVVALVGSQTPKLGMLALLIELYLFTLFLAAANDLRSDPRALRIVLTTWAVSSLFWAFLLIGAAHHFLPRGLENLLIENAGSKRASGAARNPNLAASYLIVSFFVFAASPWPRSRLLKLAGLGWIGFAAYSTGSNGGLLGLAAGLVVLAFARYARTARRRQEVVGLAGATILLLALLIGAFVAVAGVPQLGLSEVQTVASTSKQGAFKSSLGRLDKSVGSRLRLWASGWDQAGRRLPIGVGPGEARDVTTSRSGASRTLHSDFVGFLIERGFLGLVALLVLFGTVLRWSGVLLLRPGPGEIRGQGLAAAAVASMAFSTAHESFHFRHVWVLYALLWAAATAVVQARVAGSEGGAGQRELVDA